MRYSEEGDPRDHLGGYLLRPSVSWVLWIIFSGAPLAVGVTQSGWAGVESQPSRSLVTSSALARPGARRSTGRVTEAGIASRRMPPQTWQGSRNRCERTAREGCGHSTVRTPHAKDRSRSG